jgi:long-chain acyl-CoA synthetase
MLALATILDRAAWLYADSPGVRQGSFLLTYAEIGRRVAQLAGGMLTLGLKPGDRVAMLARNSFRNLEIHLAVAHAGLILVPINIRLAPPEIDKIIELTRPGLLFRALPYDTEQSCIDWSDADEPGADNAYERLLRAGTAIPPHLRKDEDVAQIYFTSGTTGEPKGACLSEQNLVNSALDSVITLQLSAKTVWFHASPMFHLVDAFAVWAITLVGGCHVTEHFDPRTFCATVEKERVTTASLPPTLLDMIVRSPEIQSYDLSSLDRISYGGAPMRESTYQRCAAAFGCPVVQSYGATEVSGGICQQMPWDVVGKPWRNSVGQPLPHIQLHLLGDNREQVSAGEVGEVAIGGTRVMAGYWENPKATKAAFHDGLYLTGDLARCDALGHVTILGRKKDMIISGGENVYPAEVEKVLLSHGEVLEAAVFGIPHHLWGEQVTAVVVLNKDSRLSADDLIDYCRQFVGGYKLPKKVSVWPEELPKSGPGKILKSTVRKRYLEEKA